MKPVTRIMRPYDGSPSPSDLLELLSYDPDTGELHWKKRDEKWFSDGFRTAKHNASIWNAKYAGRPALTHHNRDGYACGHINSRPILAHAVAWAVYCGEWPVTEIDHINGIRDDNRASNLRLASRQLNNRNKRLIPGPSGVVGVAWYQRSQKWVARIGDGKRDRFLGYFDILDDAIAARRQAEIDLGYKVGSEQK